MQAIVFFVTFLLLVFSYGSVFCFAAGRFEHAPAGKVFTYGFMTMLAVFETVFIPCMLLGTSFSVLFYLFIAVSVLVVILTMLFLISGKLKITLWEKIDIRSIVLILMLVGIAVYVAWMHFDNYDDGYYVAISNIALEENSITLNTNVAYTGDYYFADSCPRPTVNSWELLVAFFCKLSSLHPAIAFHTVLPLLLIPVFVLAAMNTFRKICKSKPELQFAALIYIFLFFFFDKSMQMISPYCTIGTSNGKAILWYFVFPLVTECGIGLYQEEEGISLWARFVLLSLAAISATATGVYTIPMLYAMFGLPYILIRLFSRDRTIGRKTVKMFTCLIPAVLIGLYSVLSISESKNSWAEMFTFNFGKLLNDTYRDSWATMLLACVCLILMIVFGKKDGTWKFFLSNTVMLVLVVFNPLTAPYIAEHITGTPVYDRLFLLFLTILIIPIGAVYLFRFFRSRIIKCVVTLVMILAVLFQGMNWNTLAYYNKQLPHQNAYMIRNDVMETVWKFDKIAPGTTVRMLGDYKVNRFFRQYSSRYHIIVARYDTVPHNETGKLYLDTYQDLFVNRTVSDRAMEGIAFFDVNYIVTTAPIEATELFRLIYITEDNELYIYERV